MADAPARIENYYAHECTRRPGIDKSRLVYHAMSDGREDLVRDIFSVGLELTPAAIEKRDSPLKYALENRFYRMAKLLVELGVDVNDEGRGGLTPLHLAAKQMNEDMMRFLIEAGADPSKRATYNGETPLHKVVRYRKIEPAQMLIAARADVNSRSIGGWTPLHVAVISNSRRSLDALIEHGADLEVQDDDGLTALHAGAERCRGDLIEILCSHNANLKALDNDERTPLRAIIHPRFNLEGPWRDAAASLIANGAVFVDEDVPRDILRLALKKATAYIASKTPTAVDFTVDRLSESIERLVGEVDNFPHMALRHASDSESMRNYARSVLSHFNSNHSMWSTFCTPGVTLAAVKVALAYAVAATDDAAYRCILMLSNPPVHARKKLEIYAKCVCIARWVELKATVARLQEVEEQARVRVVTARTRAEGVEAALRGAIGGSADSVLSDDEDPGEVEGVGEGVLAKEEEAEPQVGLYDYDSEEEEESEAESVF